MASTDKKNVISSLIESGKAKGKLSTKDITDALEELDYDVEQVDKLYSMLEGQNIEIVEEGASLDDDLDKLDLEGEDSEDALDLSFVDGVNIKDIPYNQLWQKIGYVPQAKASAFAYSTQEMVILGRNAHLGTFRQPKKRDWEIAEACMEEIGIGYLKGKLCSHISGGELQMVLIARALAANPSILVLDEPESNLDFRNQLIVLEAIERLCREKHISAVVNTHYPEHALSISQKALLLTAHGTTLFGPTDEILSEEHLNEAFGVEVRLYPLTLRNRTYTCVLPLGLKERMERGA